MHSSAFQTKDPSVAIMGTARAGKSTTLLGMRSRGYEAIVDDLLPIHGSQSGSGLTCSGWPRPAHIRARTVDMLPEWEAAPALASAARPDHLG